MTGHAQTADRAKGLVEQFQSLFNRQSEQLKNQAGTVLLVVDSAKIICSETIPARKINTLKVADPRSVVEGKRLANIEDVARGRNIKPWPCKCKKRPSGSDYLPCDYNPQGLWNPGVKTETSDAASPSQSDTPQSRAYQEGYKTGLKRGLETSDNLSKYPGVDQSIQSISDQVGVSQEYMRSMAGMESTGNPAVGGGRYTGLYQMGPRAAKDVGFTHAQVTGLSNVNNNITAAARFAKQNQTALQNAGIPATPANLYLAHQQGAGGAVQLLNSVASNPGGALTRNMLSQRYPSFVRNQGDFLDYTRGKFDGIRDGMSKGASSSGGGSKLAIPQPATLKCTYGGTISIVDPGQSSKVANPGGVRSHGSS